MEEWKPVHSNINLPLTLGSTEIELAKICFVSENQTKADIADVGYLGFLSR